MRDEAKFLEISNPKNEEQDRLLSERENAISQIGGIALEGLARIDKPESHFLSEQAEQVKELVAGHDEDIDSIMNAISGQAFRDSSEPYSMLITGPEGSGKTETAQAISEVLAEGKHIRVDCSMFRPGTDPAAVMAISFIEGQGNFNLKTGDPAEDSDETDGVPDVVIFENIETADQSFHDYLSSGAMKDGKFVITTTQGMTAITVSDSLFIFTSRLGTGAYSGSAGYKMNAGMYPKTESGHMSKAEIKDESDKQMSKIFDDDFQDMIGHRVYYESLSDADLGDVLSNYVANYEGYQRYGIEVNLPDEIRDEIVKSVNEKKRNATTVVRQYKRLIEPDISRMAASGNIPSNHQVFIVKDENGEYACFGKPDTNKLINELNVVRSQFYPLINREEDLIQALEDQGVGFDEKGNPVLDEDSV
ncbi:MAG: AAA family ATPase [bacterium]|nr:AAA family ATPase [bacterium]MDN5835002.1 AAA family ATPase [bacterium]